MRCLLLQVIVFCGVQALENPVPSSHLPPRNFNPHPYQNSVFYSPSDFQNYERKFEELSRRFQNTAPLQFPANPGNELRNLQKLDQQRRIVSHIVENQALIPHPYARLALNYRNQQLQRFNGLDHQSQTYQALANHGRKVQNNEFQKQQISPQARINNRIDDDYQEDVVDLIKSSSRSFDKKHYKFSYAVKDGKSGDDFSHTQKQENGAVQGSYKVHLPDGRVQIVKYTADDIHGYRAEVSYEGEANIHQPTNLLAPAQHTHKIFYPQAVKQVEVNSQRHSVTPTPYLGSRYNIQAPLNRNYFASTTSLPKRFYK